MSRIVAGRFDRSFNADAALAALQRAGFRSGEYESFYVPPHGPHPVEIAGNSVIAINVDRAEMEARAFDVLRRHGAREVGRTQGEWRNGSWRDFDPRSPLGAA